MPFQPFRPDSKYTPPDPPPTALKSHIETHALLTTSHTTFSRPEFIAGIKDSTWTWPDLVQGIAWAEHLMREQVADMRLEARRANRSGAELTPAVVADLEADCDRRRREACKALPTQTIGLDLRPLADALADRVEGCVGIREVVEKEVSVYYRPPPAK